MIIRDQWDHRFCSSLQNFDQCRRISLIAAEMSEAVEFGFFCRNCPILLVFYCEDHWLRISSLSENLSGIDGSQSCDKALIKCTYYIRTRFIHAGLK